MLNNDAMAQLKGLKQEIEAQKEHVEATVKGTQNRYGFAVVDDGREIFIPPDEMLKVLPGDRVQICIRPAPATRDKSTKGGKGGKENRTVADIERLISSQLDRFVGQVVTKGKAVFVQPDVTHLHRWLFIPPHARNGAKAGDYVECALFQHPIKDGKPSAKVLQRFGDATTPGIENRYCATRVGLAWEWPEKSARDLLSHAEQQRPLEDPDRTDLSHLAFVSIDSARTVDIDDALYAEVTPEGWALYVAVADPSAFLDGYAPLRDELLQRGNSVYFHGDMVPMFPEALSRDFCALAEEQTRPALVCKMTVSDAGEVGEFSFFKAIVKSQAKLSYAAVHRYITGNNNELMVWSNPLEALVQAYRALRKRREQQELVMEDRLEYRWHLTDERQIDHIEVTEKMASQHLVEECMIAANRCAGQFLADAGASGPFVVHRGFRKDRLEEAKAFLTRYQPALADEALDTVSGYQKVLRGLALSDHPLPLRAMINRLLTRAELSAKPGYHMGMALQSYTNFTSPLRKTVDFIVHQQIKALLAGAPAQGVQQSELNTANTAIQRSRGATAAAERWLAANYLARLKQDGQATFQGAISHITSSGFTVRLKDTGIEGLVDLRKDPEKFSFDKWTASLTSSTRRFQLDDAVEVVFNGAGPGEDWVSHLSLVEGCGLKPSKE